MKALVTGAGGMLARAVLPMLERGGHETLALDRAALDVADGAAFDSRARAFGPDWIVHLAAFTKVDDCEARSGHAHRVNGEGAGNAARAAAACGAAVLAISTDYVFDGMATRPYSIDAPVGPQSAYGASKLAGEEAVRRECPRHVIVRTAWLYGTGGPNFVDTILRKARAGEPLKVVDDQRGAPTWTEDLARALGALIERESWGTFHVTSAGDCTWFDLAAHLVAHAGSIAPLERMSSSELARPARRPAYSVLALDRYEQVTGGTMRPWREAVDAYLESGVAAPR